MKVATLRRHVTAGYRAALEHEAKLRRIVEDILAAEGPRAADRFVAAATVKGLHAAADIGARTAMVAVYPTDEQAALLHLQGGERADILHVTLAFLGEITTDQEEAAVAAIAEVAELFGPLTGAVGGIASFGDYGNGYPSILLPDVDGLAELRHAVCEALDARAVPRMTNHGWTPHMTLAYTPEPDPPPAWMIGRPLEFAALSVAVSDNRRDVPLGVPALAAAAGKGKRADWAQPHGDEVVDAHAIVTEIRSRSADVRQAVVQEVMTPALEAAGLDFDLTTPAVDAVLGKTAQHITYIAETTQLNVMRIVRESYEQGLSIPETSEAIRQGMAAAAPVRATLIARTEMAALVNGGSLAAVQAVDGEVGVGYQKRWLTAPGATFPRHELDDGLDGQTVALDATFDVNGSPLQYPGDPDGPPDEVCNCRCTLSYVDRSGEEVGGDEGLAASGSVATSDKGAEIADVAEKHAPDGGYGDTAWHAESGTVYWVCADWTGNDEIDAAVADFGAIEGVDTVEYEAEAGLPDSDGWEIVWSSSALGGDAVVAALPSAGDEPEQEEHMPRVSIAGAAKKTQEDEALVASATAFKDFPLAAQDEAWDAGSAEASVREWAAEGDGSAKDDVDWGKYAQGFFWKDGSTDGEDFADYKLGFVKIVDGNPVAVWRGVTAAAGAIQGARGGVNIPAGDVAAVKSHIGSYYEKAAKQFDDPSIKPPWEPDGKAGAEADALGLVEVVPNANGETHIHLHLHGGALEIADGASLAATEDAPTAEDVRGDTVGAIEPPDDPGLNAGQLRWHAFLVPEGMATEDRRAIAPGAITWRDVPLSLMALLKTSEGGHIDAELAGRIDRIWRDEQTGWIEAEGVFDDSDYGRNVARLVRDKTLRGNSVDLAIQDAEVGPRDAYVDESGRWLDGVTRESAAAAGGATDPLDALFADPLKQLFVIWDAVIGASTVCPFPAFAEANIGMTADGRKVGHLETVPMRWEFFVEDSIEMVEGLTAAAAGIAPVDPPEEWFERPAFEGPTPLTVTEEGRIFGHAWEWGTCHIGIQGGCTTAPYSETNYSYFLTKQVKTEEGRLIRVGTITLGTGHKDIYASRRAAEEHYANTGLAAADIVLGEDEFGGWFSGAIRPNLDAARVRELRGAAVSGDWRPVRGNRELVALLAVNVPGFPVPRARGAVVASADGDFAELGALVAAGIVAPRPEDARDDASRSKLAALAARATGGLEALAALAAAPHRLALDDAITAAAALFDSEDGLMDVMGDIAGMLNPGDSYDWCVIDVAIGGDTAIVGNWDGGDYDYWAIPLTYGDDKEPVIGPKTEWTPVESTWVESQEKYAGAVEAFRASHAPA